MGYCYISVPARSQAFLVERRIKSEGLYCEITYMPREVMTELCNMGVRFDEAILENIVDVIRRSGIPGLRVFKEMIFESYSQYEVIPI
jgi:Protein of unknown function (DUF3343).